MKAMDVQSLVGSRHFSRLRADLKRFNKAYDSWHKAARLGGRETVDKVVDKVASNPMAQMVVARAATGGAQGGNHKVAGNGSMIAGLASKVTSMGGLSGVLNMAANGLIGDSKGTRGEAEELIRMWREIEDQVSRLPRTGPDSVIEIKKDSALISSLEEGLDAYQSLLEFNGPSGVASMVSSFLG